MKFSGFRATVVFLFTTCLCGVQFSLGEASEMNPLAQTEQQCFDAIEKIDAKYKASREAAANTRASKEAQINEDYRAADARANQQSQEARRKAIAPVIAAYDERIGDAEKRGDLAAAKRLKSLRETFVNTATARVTEQSGDTSTKMQNRGETVTTNRSDGSKIVRAKVDSVGDWQRICQFKRGESAAIMAMGEWCANAGNRLATTTNADGSAQPGTPILTGAPIGALIGRFNGKLFFVGRVMEFKAPTDGTLEMRINDPGDSDNDGLLRVIVVAEPMPTNH